MQFSRKRFHNRRPSTSRRTAIGLIFAAAFFYANSGQSCIAQSKPADAAAAERIRESIEFLASDRLEGRGIGSEGIEQAADFIKREFAEAGLQTNVINGDAWQAFEIPWKTELGADEKNRLTIRSTANANSFQKFQLERDFIPMADGGSGSVRSAVVFAGYGITAKDEGYDDYAGLDVKNKAVLILRREPQQNDPHSIFNGTDNSTHALFRIKISNAYEHGAAALIIMNDSYSLKDSLRGYRDKIANTLDEIETAKAEYIGQKTHDLDQIRDYATNMKKLAKQLESAAIGIEKPVDKLVAFQSTGAGRRTMPVIFVKRSVFASAIAETYDGQSLEVIEQRIDEELKPDSRELTGIEADLQAEILRQNSNVKNVIGVMPGKGDLASQVLVVGAHYDHVGMGGSGSGSLAPWTREIHNGADDNASGTAGLLEIARSVGGMKSDNHRTVVLISFTGEERGLLGSAYYVKNPLYPLDRTVAMVNLDMIGRLKENKLIVYGTGTAPTFDKLVDDVNADYEFKIVKKPTGYGPSDHESFYTRRIPVFHIFTGLHTDYHRPGDDIEKINLDGTARITAMVQQMVRRLATVADRPEYVAIGRQREKTAGKSGARAYFGSQPDFGSEVAEGYAISGATPGSPAEKGGLKGGDVIIKLGESRIGGLEDFDSALRKYKAGETVDVIVVREGREEKLKVTLESR